MSTTDKIMALAIDYADWQAAKGFSHPATTEARQALRKEIEALARDAERYRFAIDDRSFAVCKFDDEKRRWVPIKNNETIDAAIQEKQS